MTFSMIWDISFCLKEILALRMPVEQQFPGDYHSTPFYCVYMLIYLKAAIYTMTQW